MWNWIKTHKALISDVLVGLGSIGMALGGEISWEAALAAIVLKLLPSGGGSLGKLIKKPSQA